MAAKNRDGVKDSEKEKVEKAWRDVEKTEGDKQKAEFMQHQYAHHYLTEFASIITFSPSFHGLVYNHTVFTARCYAERGYAAQYVHVRLPVCLRRSGTAITQVGKIISQQRSVLQKCVTLNGL